MSEFQSIYQCLMLIMMAISVIERIYKLIKSNKLKFGAEQNKNINYNNYGSAPIGIQTNVATPNSLNSPQTPYSNIRI